MPRLRPRTRIRHHAVLAAAAEAWPTLALGGPLRAYGLRHGVADALAGQQPATVRHLMTDFSTLQARLAQEQGAGATALADDAAAAAVHHPTDAPLELWAAFFRERVHLLRRGDGAWGADKILLQLAVEHADDSPVTAAAEAWLAAGHCDWLWLRRARRPERAMSSACLRVLEGHTSGVKGALVLSSGRVLSWSWDGSLRLWDVQSGECVSTLEGHTKGVLGALELSSGRVLSWSADDSLRLWDAESGQCVSTLERHTGRVQGALELSSGRVLSWSGDGNLQVWDSSTGACLSTLEEHGDSASLERLADGRWRRSGAVPRRLDRTPQTAGVVGACELSGGQLLSWSQDSTLRVWSGAIGSALWTLAGHTKAVLGALELPDGRLLSWSMDRTLRLWDGTTGAPLAILEGHTARVLGAVVLHSGRVVSWSHDRTLRLWDGATGRHLATWKGHTKPVYGAVEASPERVLSWSADGTLRMWSASDGVCLFACEGHETAVRGVKVVLDGRLLSWSDDATLRVWDGTTGARLARLRGHTGAVSGVVALSEDRLLSCSEDGTLRNWRMATDTAEATTTADSRKIISGGVALGEGWLLVGDEGGTVRLWQSATGEPVATLDGSFTLDLGGAQRISKGRVLVWDLMGAAVFCSESGALLTRLEKDWFQDDGSLDMDLVAGASVLANHRVLVWFESGALSLWDAETGSCIAMLEGHTDAVEGVTQLSDEQVLSWSRDGTLRLWDGRTGALIWSVAKDDAAAMYPDAATAWADTSDADGPGPVWYAVGSPGRTGLPESAMVAWHAGGEWTLLAAEADGSLAAFCFKDLAFLQLHHGARRITLEEATELLGTATDGSAPRGTA